jgi:hypothetical protein
MRRRVRSAVSTILMPASTITCRYSSYGGGLIVGRIVRFTPNGLSGQVRGTSAISLARSAGRRLRQRGDEPQTRPHSPRRNEFGRPTHCIAALHYGCSTPNVSVNFVVDRHRAPS